MQKEAREIVKVLSLEEKAGLCSGEDFWHLKSIKKAGLQKIMVTDGPHGLRKQTGESDHVGLNQSVPATCFPPACTTASSWDPDMIFEMGQALGEECLQEQVSVILGPGANIKRSPLCGRNFEYFSEDPLLSGKMAAAWIKGVQSKGIGTSLKHFAMNNQETRRMTVNSVVDERAQREIYLKSFEIAVKEGKPWTVMCSYNRVDGTYLSDNKRLLNDILREEWGYDGAVVSDWGATNDRVKGIQAGMDLEMPGSRGINDERIVKAVRSGELPEQMLDRAAMRVVDLILKAKETVKEGYTYDTDAHHALARKIAANSAVLLKNDGTLPLKKTTKIAIIGAFAKTPRYQGAGSSIITPIKIESMCDALDNAGIPYQYAPGYDLKTSQVNQGLIDEAVLCAVQADIAIILAGLTDDFESEGYDRDHINLPENHTALINAVAKTGKKTVVLLQNGAPVCMPWINDVSAVLECFLGGQAGGGAVVDLVYGDVNPSGKLAETFPLKLEDTPCNKHFPGSKSSVEYRESIYVGYRYYDKARKDVLFPFGFGLSYTNFEYSDLNVNKRGDGYVVKLNVKNIGDYDGAEVVQLYVKNAESVLFKPEKELRAFSKVFLKRREQKTVEFILSADSFSYYNVNISDWHVEAGHYSILIGSSSKDIRLTKKVEIEDNSNVVTPDFRQSLSEYYDLVDGVFDISADQFYRLYGQKPCDEFENIRPFHSNSTLSQTKGTLVGNMMLWMINKQTKQMVGDEGNRMMEETIKEMPIRAFGMMGGDRIPKYFSEALVLLLNRKTLKGISMMLKK
jgi:beta-glucosidase